MLPDNGEGAARVAGNRILDPFNLLALCHVLPLKVIDLVLAREHGRPAHLPERQFSDPVA